MRVPHQKLPASGEAREALRVKGQFWTPDWVAEAMVAYVLGQPTDHIFDPAVGAGAFFRAAKRLAAERNRTIRLLGTEIDPEALTEAQTFGLKPADLADVELRDFALYPPERTFSAIVGNPPYIRHHRLSASGKAHLQRISAEILGKAIDGRAGLHVYFLLQALRRLSAEGRLAFILPADVCEGVFARDIWQWITRRYRLDAVITFTPEASPFPRVDTNALVFLIQNAPPQSVFSWGVVREVGTVCFRQWVEGTVSAVETASMTITSRPIAEALETGFSRPPYGESGEIFSGPVLGDFAHVLRGIATGANEFFFLTRTQAAELELPGEFLLPAVGRTRDVSTDTLTGVTLDALDKQGRPTLLLSLDNRPVEKLPLSVQRYLGQGEAMGLPGRSLIGQRRPWYKMETRQPAPPFLFAYLGRRHARFIRNHAEAMPLTGFLCVYPRQDTPSARTGLWQVLQHPETVAALSRVGKSYGDGAIKVEPRSLERLPLPAKIVESAGLVSPRLLLETSGEYHV